MWCRRKVLGRRKTREIRLPANCPQLDADFLLGAGTSRLAAHRIEGAAEAVDSVPEATLPFSPIQAFWEGSKCDKLSQCVLGSFQSVGFRKFRTPSFRDSVFSQRQSTLRGREVMALERRARKVIYYATNAAASVLPRAIYQRKLNSIVARIQSRPDYEYIADRVNYYNKLRKPFEPSGVQIGDWRYTRPSMYYYDLLEHIRYFPSSCRFDFSFGDIREDCPRPAFTKSRAIVEHNQNNVLMKLDKLRHFRFPRDPNPFESKKNQLVWRGAVYQPHRIEMMRQCFGAEMCDIGQTNRAHEDPRWQKPPMSVRDQLRYKFILSVEGNDVATNLKWVLSSNSLCLMTRPTCEAWFMEGRLIPDYHYVLLRDDYSDIVEKIRYYVDHPKEAQEIIRNAHEYVDQFRDLRREWEIGLMVARKYFILSGCLDGEI